MKKLWKSLSLKMVYAYGEIVSKLNFATNYSKQAAGPMDNRVYFILFKSFLKQQKWF